MSDLQAFHHRQKRALYRACHRGTKELDALLGGYVTQYVFDMGEDELCELERFLALPDPVLDVWLMGREVPDEAPDKIMVDRVRTFHKLD